MSSDDGPHHICRSCGEISDPSTIDTELQLLGCRHCATTHRYELVPPILFLTGANGAGKSAIYEHLVGRVDEAILIDQDLLWGLNPAHDDPQSGFRAFRTVVLAMAMRLAANGRVVVVEGTTVPWEYEALPARPLVSRTSYVAAVCHDDDLRTRLRARPPWRQQGDDAVEGMVRMNRAFKDEGPGWPPGVRLVDTSEHTVAESAEIVRSWITAEHDWWQTQQEKQQHRP